MRHSDDSRRTFLFSAVPVFDMGTGAFLGYRGSGEWTFGSWLRSLARPQTFPLASFKDPGPSLVSFLRRAKRFLSVHLKRTPAGPVTDSR